MRLKESLYRLIPLQLLQRAMPRDVIGIHYHVVSSRPLPHIRHLHPYKTPAQFESDLRYLRDHFELLSYAEIVRSRERGGSPNSVALTFDDGYAECFTTVRPLLLKYEIPCTFFVTTGCLDNRRLAYRNRASLCIERIGEIDEADRVRGLAECERIAGLPIRSPGAFKSWILSLGPTDPALDRMCDLLGVDTADFLRAQQPYLTVEQVRILAADGFTIGAHTVTHPPLGSIEDRKQVEDEIVESCLAVRDLVGAKIVPFAFPFSGEGVAPSFMDGLRRRYPFVGLVFDTHRLRIGPEFVINRISVERPPPRGEARSNLGYHFRRAYINRVARTMRQCAVALVTRDTPRL